MQAAEFIRNGGIVAFPTETVYGLGASVFNEAAVEKIFEAKGRPSDNPLITHIYSRDQMASLATDVTPSAAALIEAFMPGPLTVVLAKAPDVPSIATAGLRTIGIRMPGSSLAREFLRRCNVPVSAPSANLSGRPSPTTWNAVAEDLDGRIDCILQGDRTEIGLESTVVNCTGGTPVLLRQGAISIEELRAVVPDIQVVDATSDLTVHSPGLRHKHYSPKARISITDDPGSIQSGKHEAYIGISPPGGAPELVRLCGEVRQYARSLFEFFRECDRAGITTIYCEAVDEAGLGAALMDRLRRASEG